MPLVRRPDGAVGLVRLVARRDSATRLVSGGGGGGGKSAASIRDSRRGTAATADESSSGLAVGGMGGGGPGGGGGADCALGVSVRDNGDDSDVVRVTAVRIEAESTAASAAWLQDDRLAGGASARGAAAAPLAGAGGPSAFLGGA